MINPYQVGPLVLAVWVATLTSSNSAETLSPPSENSASGQALKLQAPATTIWQEGVGEGFLSTTETLSVEVGGAWGRAMFGSKQAHDLALSSLSYGHMWGPVLGEGHWYRGNFELRGELFGGGQYYPRSSWLVGLTPHLRYNFATGTRWIPFLDAGAGVTATGISRPDLSGTFEFNLQPGAGVHWFFRDHVALTTEVRYIHFSCAGTHTPNLGMNDVAGFIGMTWFL